METNSLHMSWMLAGFAIIVGFAALYYASEARVSIVKRLNKFVDSTVSKFENDLQGLDESVVEVKVHINEQLNKLRLRDKTRQEEIAEINKQLSELRGNLKNLDNRILPKYKR